MQLLLLCLLLLALYASFIYGHISSSSSSNHAKSKIQQKRKGKRIAQEADVVASKDSDSLHINVDISVREIRILRGVK